MDEKIEIWVEAGGFGRCRLDRAAFTWPGRIDAWSETLRTHVTLDRRDVTEASREAWIWIDGFLAGNAPSLQEFLALDYDSANAAADEQPTIWDRYWAALDHLRATGSMPYPMGGRATLPPPPDLPLEPWILRIGQVLRWDGTAWVPQDPQPAMRYAMMVGTVCDARSHCRSEGVGDWHLYCPDCGELTELAPE